MAFPLWHTESFLVGYRMRHFKIQAMGAVGYWKGREISEIFLL